MRSVRHKASSTIADARTRAIRVGSCSLTGNVASVYLAGLRIPDEDVRELIRLVDEPTRSFLEKSLALDGEVVALRLPHRAPTQRVRLGHPRTTRWKSYTSSTKISDRTTPAISGLAPECP